MNYDEIVDTLRSNHFYPTFIKKVTARSEKTVGLSVYCPPIMKDSKIERLREVLGELVTVKWTGRGDEIRITL